MRMGSTDKILDFNKIDVHPMLLIIILIVYFVWNKPGLCWAILGVQPDSNIAYCLKWIGLGPSLYIVRKVKKVDVGSG